LEAEYIPVELNDGTIINIEAIHIGGEQTVSIDLLSLADITTTVKSISKDILTAIKEVEPTKATVEFGLSIGIEAGKLTTLLVKGQGTANLKITLEWSKTV